MRHQTNEERADRPPSSRSSLELAPDRSDDGEATSREVKVTTGNQEAEHVGYPICEGPGVMRLLLTWPYSSEGQIVEIERERITSISDVEPRTLGEPPIGSKA